MTTATLSVPTLPEDTYRHPHHCVMKKQVTTAVIPVPAPPVPLTVILNQFLRPPSRLVLLLRSGVGRSRLTVMWMFAVRFGRGP